MKRISSDAMAAWKKNGKRLFKFKNKLIEGMQKTRGYETEFAERSLNRYAVLVSTVSRKPFCLVWWYQPGRPAWLKCYYPECFYASLLNSQPMGFIAHRSWYKTRSDTM
ncbi:hypothetical protein O9992_02795 [Vibrio lentus]|nr:hypothetical protein [Vibrio lentus]